ncbi:MAG TPA: hypothetical protein VJS13_08070 [Pyrinomonadaceae bacterium]|nr:hypothetical protein [Pyrinomonadaceae bacterium]
MATQTDLTADDLRELVNKATQKDRRTLSFSILFSVLAVAAGSLWLWYAYDRVQTLDKEYAARLTAQDNQLKQKSRELDEKTAAVDAKQKELVQVQKEVTQLQSDLQALKQFSAQVTGELSAGNEVRAQEVVATSLRENLKVATLLPRVYLHIQSEEQRAKAKDIATSLQKQGYLAPGIESVRVNRLEQTVVRYFRETEKDEATQIAKILQSLGVKAVPQYIKGSEDSTKMRPRHYEVWFSADFY